MANRKKMLIQMCAMEYDSEFHGIWDGKYLTIKAGEIKIPNELEKYIKRPIDKVGIESAYFRFDKDTLKINNEYYMVGEITAIKNSIPIIKAYIRR